jgi:HAD superfamily hydrolase (TIGR01509 family)
MALDGPPAVVLFDLGGVVCNFDPGPRLAALSRDCGLPPEEIHARVWESGLTREFDSGRLTSAECYRVVRDRIGLRMDQDAFGEVILSALSVNRPMLDLVDEVRMRARTAMLTDNPPLLLEAMPVRFPELLERFDPITFSCQIGALKPSAVAFEAALSLLGEAAANVVFIDDTAANVEGATSVGMRSIRYTGLEHLRRDLTALGLLGET